MEKIILRLVLVFCWAFALFVPRIGFAASVDLTMIAHTVNGDGVFNFSASGSGTGLPPVDFSITTQGGAGQYQVVLPNPDNQFSILQLLPDGWRQTDAACTDTASGTQFSYLNNPWNNGTIGVTLGGGEHHIVCDVTDQYSADWLVIPNTTVKVIVNTINGDDTFNFIESNGTGYNIPPIEFSIATQNNSGDHLITLQNPSNKFYVSQVVPAGWRQTGLTCVATRTGTGFAYAGDGVTVTENNGNDNIVCTITNEYREEWLQDNFNGYFTINTNTINGDGTFDYTVFNNAGPTFPPGNFTVTTANGSGMSQYVWAGDSYRFSLTQFHPDGWQPVSLFCQDTNPGAKFEYDLGYHSAVTITINRGYNRITCTFTNQKIVPEKFVYVALGDSYQSGEGAGNSIADTNAYLNAYENGSNYLRADGAQKNTYTPSVNYGSVSPSGDGCHRALNNYAKTIRDQLKPGAEIILIDETCSGATIDPSSIPGAKLPIVGKVMPGQIDPDSQIAKALAQLESLGLTADKVNLVTVGMGGNDAKFSDLVQACMLASFSRKVISQYPNRPAEVETIANQFATCQNFDNLWFDTNGVIDGLANTEMRAQDKILSAFANARVMQLNYPGIVPVSDNLINSNSCGGIRKEDLNYLRGKITKINEKIEAAVAAIRALGNTRLELVDVKNIFGSNPLCPQTATAAYANGIDENNFSAEIDRLLNKNNQGDQTSRELLDKVFADYDDLSHCARWDVGCRSSNLAKIALDGNAWVNYLAGDDQYKKIAANIVVPSAEDIAIRFDRSRGLFHPNAKGQALTACYVKAAFNQTSPAACLPSYGPMFADSANGQTVGNVPIAMAVGEQLQGEFGGFDPNTPQRVGLSSTPADLGTFMSDSNGVVHVSFAIPDIGPGVHTLKIIGNSAAKTELVKQARVQIPGDPVANSSYGMYLPGFVPNDGVAESEKIDISYLGATFETLTPDENGGVFVEIPTFNQSGPISVTAKSETTSREVIQTINVINDNAAPVTTATINGAMGQPNYYRSDVSINLDAADTAQEGIEPSGVSSINYWLDNNATTTIESSTTTISVRSEGEHVLTYFSQDKAQNVENAKSLAFTIDTTSPTVELTPNSGNYNIPFAFNWKITDALSGIDSATCNIKVDAVTVSTNCSDIYQLTAGSHVITVSASDNAGNATSESRNYTVSNPETGILIINKKAGTVSATFNFNIAGSANLTPSIATINGTGTTGTLNLPVGQYTLSEIIPAGWKLTGTACSSSCVGNCSSSISTRNGVVSFKIQKNLKLTCTFTNARK